VKIEWTSAESQFRENAFASSIVEVTTNQKVITTGPYDTF